MVGMDSGLQSIQIPQTYPLFLTLQPQTFMSSCDRKKQSSAYLCCVNWIRSFNTFTHKNMKRVS